MRDKIRGNLFQYYYVVAKQTMLVWEKFWCPKFKVTRSSLDLTKGRNLMSIMFRNTEAWHGHLQYCPNSKRPRSGFGRNHETMVLDLCFEYRNLVGFHESRPCYGFPVGWVGGKENSNQYHVLKIT